MQALVQQQIRNQSSHLVSPVKPDLSASRLAHAMSPIMRQQQALGNQAVQRMLQSRIIQAKLAISKPGDRYEQEADRAADQLMRMPEPCLMCQVEPEEKKEEETVQTKPSSNEVMPLIQRQTEPKEEEDEEKAQTKLTADQSSPAVQRQVEPEEEEVENIQAKAASGMISGPSTTIQSHINTLESGGHTLSESTRSYFEPRFGRDLSSVRVHSDSRSADSARSINAQAFTVGRAIFFGTGYYNPSSNEGRRLIAHELTHVIQQRPDAVPTNASANRADFRSAPKNQGLKSPAVSTFPAGQRIIARLDGAETAAPPQEEIAAAAPASGVPAEAVSLGGTSTFEPPAAIASSLEDLGEEPGEVRVRLGNIAEGNIRVRKINNEYETYPRERPQTIPLHHPVLEPLRTRIGIDPVLALSIRANNISGYASVATERGAPNPSALFRSLRDNFEAMGWLGMEPVSFPGTRNELDAGILKLKAEGFSFRLGGFLDGTGSFGLENEAVTFEANAAIHLRGLTDAQLEISRDEEGNLGGQAEVPVNFANFSGNIIASFGSGTVDIQGTAGYTTEKLSGEITLLVTDAATARNVALQRLGPEAVQAAAEEAQGARTGRPRPGARALAGWGVLDFQFTEWMTGQAQVIIDNEGHVTVVGRIAPPAEIELFPQRDYIRRLFVFEVRTLYGVPLVGNVFLFANVGMEALAKLGPGKIYRIEVLGTYSTDPRVLQNFSISATLNISAFAGLRLRGEGGAGLELIGHDVKAGVGLNALAGVRGYVEATPTIGYRETANPQEGRQGQFYIRGHMELAAQPFLGLGGDLFVELDSPFWSPVPDRKWTWPVGELEYPLPGEFGIGADVDYVIGSDELPEIQFGEVDFNADRFMTDLMSDHVPRGRHGEQEQPGEWNEGEVAGAPAEPQQVDTQGAPPAAPVRGRQGPEEGEAPRPENQERWLGGLRALGELSERSQTDPFDQREIDAALARIKTRYGFTELRERRAAEKWRVHAEMNPETDIDLSAEGAAGEWWEHHESFTDRHGEAHRLFFSGDGETARLKVRTNEMFTEDFIARIRQVFEEDPMAEAFGRRRLETCIRLQSEIDNRKTLVERARIGREPSLPSLEQRLKDSMGKMSINMSELIDLLPENQSSDCPVNPGDFVTMAYGSTRRKAEILVTSRERIHYKIESDASTMRMGARTFKDNWDAGRILQYHEQGSRETYLGATPGKASATGRELIRQKYPEPTHRRTVNNVVEIKWDTNRWHPLIDCDMSHDPIDAVDYWNDTGKFYKPHPPPPHPTVRAWMLDWHNYIFEPAAINRSRGSRHGRTYDPPA